MMIYEVNLNINKDVVDDYLLWLDEHIKEMLMFNGFKSASIYQIDSTHFTVVYHVDSKDHLQDYFDNHANQMRGDGLEKFANQFSATRRIMEVVRKY